MEGSLTCQQTFCLVSAWLLPGMGRTSAGHTAKAAVAGQKLKSFEGWSESPAFPSRLETKH